MEIRGNMFPQNKIADSTLSINKNDITSIVIKERKPNNEAVVLMKGTELTVKFEGEVPAQNRAMVEVSNANSNQIVVKAITKQDNIKPAIGQTAESLLKNIASPDLRQAAALWEAKGYSLTKEVIAVLSHFLKNEAGTIEQKLNSIQALMNKNIELTPVHIKAVHSALHGEPLTASLEKILKAIGYELDPAKFVKEQTGAAKLENSIPIASQSSETALPKETGVGQSPLTKAFLELVKAVQHEPSLPALLEKIPPFLTEAAGHSEINLSSLKEAHQKAVHLQEKGRELASRKELANGLTKLQQENSVLQPSAEVILSDAEQAMITNVLQGMRGETKDIIVTMISKRLSQMAIDFKQVKQGITKNLDYLTNKLNLPANRPQMSQLLETTIRKLDNAILKGDYMLYTDMSMEKSLMKASSSLAEAKTLLQNGQISDANKIVKEVKATLDSIIFKPSDVKVKHFVSEQGLKELLPDKQVAKQYEAVLQNLNRDDLSARHVFESVKRLGFMNERETVQAMVNRNASELPENVKASLLKFLQTEEGQQPKVATQIDQAINNFTGQQLLSKPDASGMQSMLLQLPFMFNKQVENVKVFVNSKKNGEKIDWENCSLYFVLETKKLGEIGILLTAANRNLSLTFKSNKDDFQEKMEPLAEVSKEKFKEIGFNVGGVQFKKLNQDSFENKHEDSAVLGQTSAFTEKGYDFSI